MGVGLNFKPRTGTTASNVALFSYADESLKTKFVDIATVG